MDVSTAINGSKSACDILLPLYLMPGIERMPDDLHNNNKIPQIINN